MPEAPIDIAAVGDSRSPEKGQDAMPTLPVFNSADFIPGADIDNPYFPLVEGSVLSYSGTKVDEESGEEETESNDVFVISEKKLIQSVETFVVRDTAYDDGVLIEDTLDWYAQDIYGNVWYLGEVAYNYRYDDDGNFIGTDSDGSWEAGIDGALPGWIMLADPQVGDNYYQEYYVGEAEDEGFVVSLDAEISIELGDFEEVLQTLDSTALEPDVMEFKYYAAGIGQILAEEDLDEEGEPDLSVELVGIRQTGDGGVGEDIDHPDVDDFTPNSPLYVTYMGKEALFENALGAYAFDLATGEIGEGWILFDSSEDLEFGEQVAVELDEGQGLGLFLIPDVDDLSFDLEEFEEGGLFFMNMLTGAAANLDDGLAPLIVDDEGTALPIHAFHALGGEDGFNYLNPAAAALVTELDSDCLGDDSVVLIGFEDLRVTQEGFDGDYNDFVVAVSDDPAEDFLEVEDLIVGTSENDRLFGGRDDEALLGRDGNDRIWGRNGDDALCGGDGRDYLDGGRGDDDLYGGAGRDTLRGGRGEDTLCGGEGDDLLIGGRDPDVYSFGLDEGDDRILGFRAGTDLMDLSATGLSYDDLAISAVGLGQTQVEFGTGSITLAGVNAAQIDESSFVF